jgi:hypothetical protein
MTPPTSEVLRAAGIKPWRTPDQATLERVQADVRGAIGAMIRSDGSTRRLAPNSSDCHSSRSSVRNSSWTSGAKPIGV